MAHMGQKITLGTIGFLGLIFLGLQFFFLHFQMGNIGMSPNHTQRLTIFIIDCLGAGLNPNPTAGFMFHTELL